MASAQVLPNSRKLGHLEAGKKKLEEFRKKKTAGQAKKAASTGPSIASDGDHSEKDTQKNEHITDTTKSPIQASYGSGIASEPKAVNSSKINEISSSNRTYGSFTDLVGRNHASYSDTHYAGTEIPKLRENSGFPKLANGYYDQWKGSNELTLQKEKQIEPGVNATGQFDTSNPIKENANLDPNINRSSSHSFFQPPSTEDMNSAGVQMKYPETTFGCYSNTSETAERVSGQNRSELPSNLADTSGSHKEQTELSPATKLFHTSSLYGNNATDFGVGRGRTPDSSDHNSSVDRVPWHASDSSFKDSSSSYRGTKYGDSFVSAGHETSSGRSRPSFLDSLGASRGSSTAYFPDRASDKANMTGSLDTSTAQNLGFSFSSPGQKTMEVNIADQPLRQTSVDYNYNKELSTDSFVSSNDSRILNSAGDPRAHRENELFTSKKDDNFAALEQHIEDLTQEKFSLQRALETSRTLAESLADENSSLTESYNQQGQVVSQLKSDMGRLQEEIKAQLLTLESVRSEYMNAQLECNAADERAKILTSEIIGLEEKALRLRSNELMLEKQLESLNSDVTSYKRKVSILEKERQDFQSTIDALQEEKKLMQSKLRKVSKNDKADIKVSSGRDVSTSTEDLGVASSDPNEETSTADRTLYNDVDSMRPSAAMFPSAVASTSRLVLEDGPSTHSDASADIPQDQHRMIENINSLISELALEKEELVGALRIESSNCARLKDLNKDLSQKLEAQTQRLELLIAQRMTNENVSARPLNVSVQDTTQYADEGDEVVERVLGWIMKLFPGGPSKRRTSKLL